MASRREFFKSVVGLTVAPVVAKEKVSEYAECDPSNLNITNPAMVIMYVIFEDYECYPVGEFVKINSKQYGIVMRFRPEHFGIHECLVALPNTPEELYIKKQLFKQKFG